MEYYFNKIFEEYGKLAGFKAPKLQFEDVAEDTEVNAKSAMDLYMAGIVTREEARSMIGLYPTMGGTLKGDLKKSDMETWHPAEPGSASGSQAGEKDKQKTDPNSLTNPVTTK